MAVALSVHYKTIMNPLGSDMYNYTKLKKETNFELYTMKNHINSLRMQGEKLKRKNKCQYQEIQRMLKIRE